MSHHIELTMCKNMTSSTKPEAHNISLRRHTEDRATAIANVPKNSMKFGCVVFEICERTDRQTDRQTQTHTHHNTLHPPWDEIFIISISTSFSTTRKFTINLGSRIETQTYAGSALDDPVTLTFDMC